MEIAPGVHSIGQRRGGRVHAFLLDDGHDLTVIDTLFDTDGGRILSAISRSATRRATSSRSSLRTATARISAAWRR